MLFTSLGETTITGLRAAKCRYQNIRMKDKLMAIQLRKVEYSPMRIAQLDERRRMQVIFVSLKSSLTGAFEPTVVVLY